MFIFGLAYNVFILFAKTAANTKTAKEKSRACANNNNSDDDDNDDDDDEMMML